MAVNRYDNVAEYNPMQNTVSQYVPLPFEELHMALGTRQRTHDQSLNDIHQMQANALNLQSIAEHEPYRQHFVNKVNNAFTDLMNRHPDPSSPEFIKEKDKLIKYLASDPNIPILQRSVAAKKKQLEYNEDLKKKGQYGVYNDPYSRGFQGLDESGNPIEYQYQPYEASQDHTKPVYDLFDKIKPSGREAEGFQLDRSGNIIGVKRGYEGIAEDWIHKVAGRNVNTFLDTKEGQDFARKFAYHFPNASATDLLQEAHNYMKDIGSAYVYSKSKEGSDFKYPPEWVGSGIADDQLNGQAPITPSSATLNPLQPQKLEVDNNGNIGDDTNYYYKGQPISKDQYMGLVSRLNHEGHLAEDMRIEKKTPQELAQQNRMLDEGIQKYKTATGKNLSRKEYADLYNKAVDNAGLLIPRQKEFVGKKADMMTQQVLGGKNTVFNLQGKELAIVGPNGSKPLTYDQLREELGIDDKNPVTHARVVGRFSHHPLFPGGYKVIVQTKDGQAHELAVGASEQEKSYFGSRVSPVANAALSGQDVNLDLPNGKVRTETIPTEGGFATKVYVTDASGTHEMNLDDYIRAQHSYFDDKYKPLYTAGYGTDKDYKAIDTGEEAE